MRLLSRRANPSTEWVRQIKHKVSKPHEWNLAKSPFAASPFGGEQPCRKEAPFENDQTCDLELGTVETFITNLHLVLSCANLHGNLPFQVDITANPVLAYRFDIQSTPVMKLFRDRKMYSYTGSHSADHLREFLEVRPNGYEAYALA